MEDHIFSIYEGLLKSRSGIIITKEKEYLLEARLLPIAKKAECSNLAELANKIKTSLDGDLAKSIIEAMTTNETSFFRDTRPFDNLRDVIMPYFVKSRATTKRLRIWSAACSSGQEAYSISMILKEMEAKLSGWTIEIVGTDLSQDILEQAKGAKYTQFEVQRGLPVQFLVKYFEQQGEKWYLKSDIRNMVTFRQLNLLESYASMGTFDIIFCRNVLIYFNQETKASILQKLSSCIQKDGILMLGGAETVIGINSDFKSLTGHRGMYIPTEGTFIPEGSVAA